MKATSKVELTGLAAKLLCPTAPQDCVLSQTSLAEAIVFEPELKVSMKKSGFVPGVSEKLAALGKTGRLGKVNKVQTLAWVSVANLTREQ
jgi:hypothetical protein